MARSRYRCISIFLSLKCNVTHRLTKLNSIFQYSSKVRLCHSCNADIVGLFHVLDPTIRLPLRVDHERPSTSRPYRLNIKQNHISLQTKNCETCQDATLFKAVSQHKLARPMNRLSKIKFAFFYSKVY